jgi:RNA ligase (TIGR02306 family)
MRKLATIERVKNVRPIPNADSIEIVEIKGWTVVTKKGDFKKGDLCVYFEVDSVLPEREEFEFLRSNSWNERYKGFRLRTVKLRGQISQGLVIKTSILPAYIDCPFCVKDEYCTMCYNDRIIPFVFSEGDDVTKILGVVKFVPEIPTTLAGDILGLFPSFIPKTEEERIQNIESNIKKYIGEKIYITEKIDGTSSTFFFHENHFGVCSRNWELKEDEKIVYWKIARKYDIGNKLKDYGKSLAIQGEIIGPGIQKNKYNLTEIDLYLFNVYDIVNSQYLSLEELKNIAKFLGIKTVPILEENDILTSNVDYWIEKANGISVLHKTKREGIVVRTHNMKFSFKSISSNFLLKHGE